MINKQFSKCPVCGKDEKYVVFVRNGNSTIELKTCSNKCMIDEVEDKPKRKKK